MKKIKLGNWSFFLLTIVYFIISGLLFLLTTGGWSGLGVIMFLLLPFAVIASILLILTITRSVRHIKHVAYRLSGLVPLVILQLVAVLLNRKDCGDSFGSFSFLSYMLNGFNSSGMCGNDHRYAEYNTVLWMVIIGIYLISVVVSFLFMTKSVPVSKSHSEPKLQA